MPAVHISEFLKLLNEGDAPLEVKLNSQTVLQYALVQLATQCAQEKSFLITLFPSQEILDEAFSFAQSLCDDSFPSLCVWPAWEHSPFSPIASSLTQRIDRLKTLSLLSNRRPSWVFATVESWIQPTIPLGAFESSQFDIKVGQIIESREWLQGKLRDLGYTKNDPVEEPGQYTLRGEIIDIFIPSLSLPRRIELFDTEVEKIRSFHPETQRTLPEREESITVFPAEEVLFPWSNHLPVLEKVKTFCEEHHLSRKVRDPIFENIRQGFLPENFRTWIPFVYDSVGFLSDYVPKNSILASIEPDRLRNQLKEALLFLKKESVRYDSPHWIAPTEDQLYPDPDALLEKIINKSSVQFKSIPTHPDQSVEIQAEPMAALKVSHSEIVEWLEDGFKILIGSKGLSSHERIKHFLGTDSHHPNLKIIDHNPKESFNFLSEKTILLSESKILGASTHSGLIGRTSKNKNAGADFRSIKELKINDHVVHSLHGVGKYLGLQELFSNGVPLGEYLLIEYFGQDKLYLPIYRLNLIQKHVGASGNAPLDKLGNGQFEKLKQKARESARKLAVNLLDLYAKRAALKGPVFDPPSEPYDDFCDQFEFTETEGQVRAIEDVLGDVENGKLLDRLVCGDVGFGKTEVAMRAAFQAVQSGYQVAVLVPTTLLAFQHEQTFKHRMKNFPIRIESISRFKTKREQNLLLEELAASKIDIVIGTHRLLSKDIKFANLGLLVIDEEHRFGVDHKEKIKALQTNTHALTLTATPIPRTLNMAISGIKDISLIRTPPTNRQPIKTFVSSYSDEVVRSAIENELARGGQVFYLYNRVQSIEHKAKEIQKLVPTARVVTAHGQMGEAEIESRMLEFYQGRAQVLVCTTIIESGIDIPNAGTIIIHRADQLGLAQLYQIRGRVGRSHRKAFAYLMVYDQDALTQDAKMRLDALQRFVELGSGFQIASEDLEIRGGGNLLGAEQSGHVASIGLDMFTELLEDSIRELRGQKNDSETSEERQFEPEIKVPVLCEIPPSLIPDAQLRLTFYRKLSRAKNDQDVDLLYEEFLDRFGKIPIETENLFWLIRIKNLMKAVGVEHLSITKEKSVFTVRKSSKVDLDEVMKLYAGPKSVRDTRLSLTPDSKIIIQLPFVSLKTFIFDCEPLFHKIAPKAFENSKSPDKLSP